MICPKCGGEMIKGFIRSHNFYVPFIFNSDSDIPLNTKTKFNPLIAYGPFIPLSKFGFLPDPKSKAHFCNNCQIVIVDIKENLK